MEPTTSYTSTLPVDVMNQLNEYAVKLKTPKNKLIEQAVTAYLHHLRRQEYVRSFKSASQDVELAPWAGEGLEDYVAHLAQLES